MKIHSVQVSMGRSVEWRGQTIETGIFKEPVAGRVQVRRENLEGDRQSDPDVHGGEYKAVYGYSLEHYDWWRKELPREVPVGMFGENLTIEGLDESDVCVGDTFRAGSALLQAVQPRLPCFKLGIRFGDPLIIKKFLQAGRWGVYFRVLEEGEVGAGDEVALEDRDPARFSIPALATLILSEKRDRGQLRRAALLSALPPHLAEEFRTGGRSTEP